MEEHCYIIVFQVEAESIKLQVVQYLKKFSKWGKLTDNVWAIVTSTHYKDVRDSLSRMVSPTDRVMVVQSGKHAAWLNTYASNDWIRENIVK